MARASVELATLVQRLSGRFDFGSRGRVVDWALFSGFGRGDKRISDRFRRRTRLVYGRRQRLGGEGFGGGRGPRRARKGGGSAVIMRGGRGRGVQGCAVLGSAQAALFGVGGVV